MHAASFCLSRPPGSRALLLRLPAALPQPAGRQPGLVRQGLVFALSFAAAPLSDGFWQCSRPFERAARLISIEGGV